MYMSLSSRGKRYRWMEKKILRSGFRRAEPERMISGWTASSRDSSKAEGGKARRADFGPSRAKSGTTELRTHPEFGANLSGTPVCFVFLCLRAIPRKSSPAGYHSLRLRPEKTKPRYLLLQPAMPLPRDERLIYPSHHPVRWPFRRRPHLLN